MSVCDLCGEDFEGSCRGCQFGKKSLTICNKCLTQFKVEKGRVVLHDRYEEKEWNLGVMFHKKASDYGDIRIYYAIKDIKTFIQKVKEDLVILEKDHIVPLLSINKILDERAGNL